MSKTEVPSETMPSAVPRGPKERLSIIWLVPVIAILIGIGLAVQAVLARGPEITVQFQQAEGLEAGKTRVKFKEVDIGTVHEISLNSDHKSVRVSIQMNKQAEDLLAEDTRFWVVRPRIAAGGVSGLATLLSGVYIALDPGKASDTSREFLGLETPPQVTFDTPGRSFLLQADDLGSLDVGVPIYFRRIPVGRVSKYAMQKDGKGVDVNVFVDAPYDKFVTKDTRFWHASGVDVSLNSDGVKVDMQSLSSLAIGGLAFTTPDEGDMTRAEPEASFPLYQNRADALRTQDHLVHKYVLNFHESVRGLAIGGQVDYRGLIVGEVTSIDLKPRRDNPEFTIQVGINIYPERFSSRLKGSSPDSSSRAKTRTMVDQMVQRGLRAQMRTGNLVSGQRYVALEFFKNAKPAKVDWAQPVPELPTQIATIDSLQDQLLVIVDSLQKTLERVDQMVARFDGEVVPELTSTLKEARKTLESADKTLNSDAPLQVELRDTLREVGKASAAVRNLADMLERQPEALLRGKRED